MLSSIASITQPIKAPSPPISSTHLGLPSHLIVSTSQHTKPHLRIASPHKQQVHHHQLTKHNHTQECEESLFHFICVQRRRDDSLRLITSTPRPRISRKDPPSPLSQVSPIANSPHEVSEYPVSIPFAHTTRTSKEVQSKTHTHCRTPCSFARNKRKHGKGSLLPYSTPSSAEESEQSLIVSRDIRG